MVDNRMWVSMSPLRQFEKLNKLAVVKLEKKDLPWAQLFELPPNALGELIRQPKVLLNLFLTLILIRFIAWQDTPQICPSATSTGTVFQCTARHQKHLESYADNHTRLSLGRRSAWIPTIFLGLCGGIF